MSKRLVSLFLPILFVAPAFGQETTDADPEKRDKPETAAETQSTGNTDPGVKVELNKLEDVDNACRAYLVVENRSGRAFESLRLDLVMFDQQSIVARRLAVETAPLPADKTTLKVFDINKLACGGIGRILLNDVLACRGASGKRSDCLGALSVTSRGDVPFVK